MQAGNYILLKPNTQINSSSKFMAMIADCGETINADNVAGRYYNAGNLSKNGMQNDIILYPNPLSGNTLHLISDEKPKTIIIYDSLGKIVTNVLCTDNRIKVPELQPGIYIVEITSNNSTVSKKLIVR